MPDIDEFSQTLGRLEAQNIVIVDGIKDIRKHLQDLNGKTAKAHARLDDAEKITDDYIKLKNRGIMALIGISLAGGAGATGALKFLSVILGASG